mmetsp:Transcript_34516/g.38532  ORF Transcript_34516/g.38532 Transcript_34516/m.38532 type:complete len:463 (+) Transcript_34516:1-1389(+)
MIMLGEPIQKTFRSLRRGTVRTILGGAIVVGTVEVMTHFPSQGRSSYFYHALVDEWIVPTMRQVLAPEAAHKLALNLAILAPTHRPSASEQELNVVVRLWDKEFSNPIGLAAGYDKDGTAIISLMGMGFGFVEMGSVCLKAQPGNPSPRMFRLSQDEAIINRYGFNSMGADAVEENLKEFHRFMNPLDNREDGTTAQWWEKAYDILWRPKDGQRKGVLGINLGKNKTSNTPLEDYQKLIYQLGPYADYLVVNVSSPNTPGLRDLQNVTSLEELLRGCQEACKKLSVAEKRIQQPDNKEGLQPSSPPLLVKLSPDLTDLELRNIAGVLMKLGIDGIILTNTTTARPTSIISSDKNEVGGLSGKPLKDRSTECIRLLYRYTEGKIPIIGVGGIQDGRDAYEKLRAGASLVQVYSGMVYKGPGMVSQIRDEVAKLMLQNGQRNLQKDVVGMDHRDLFLKKQQQQY